AKGNVARALANDHCLRPIHEGARHTTPRPGGMDVEADYLLRAPRAETGEIAAFALDLGDNIALAQEIHRPDIAIHVKPDCPALQFGAAVSAARRAADRGLMNALDERRIARRARPDDQAARQ